MNPTPIYDELRGERINADVPAGAGRRQVRRLPVAWLTREPVFARPPWPAARHIADLRLPCRPARVNSVTASPCPPEGISLTAMFRTAIADHDAAFRGRRPSLSSAAAMAR